MNLRTQGLAFSVLAWLVVVLSLGLPRLDPQLQLALLSPVILLLGVPHGALDIVFVRRLTRLSSLAEWGLFSLAYLAAAAAVVLLWWWAPGVFLALFLLISAFHFSGDPEGDTAAVCRVLYGGAVVLCPLALHAAEVSSLFAALAGEAAAQTLVAALQWAAWPWVVAIGVAALIGAKQHAARSIEWVSMTALLTLAPPLIGFTVFFCAMHSARHVLRTRDYTQAGTLRHLLPLAAWPMLVTVAGLAVAWWLTDGQALDQRLAQLLFVGLAALTVPHMMVVERVRLTGWRLGSGGRRERSNSG